MHCSGSLSCNMVYCLCFRNPVCLQKHVEDGVGASGRTACDRIIRACNQRLGGGAPEPELQERLVDLVELATQGYGSAVEPGAQGSSLYLEKIIFHILQKLVTHGAHAAAGRLGEFMYLRLLAVSSEVWARTRLLKGRSDAHYSITVKRVGLYGVWLSEGVWLSAIRRKLLGYDLVH